MDSEIAEAKLELEKWLSNPLRLPQFIRKL